LPRDFFDKKLDGHIALVFRFDNLYDSNQPFAGTDGGAWESEKLGRRKEERRLRVESVKPRRFVLRGHAPLQS
jgi:hypothetical protein